MADLPIKKEYQELAFIEEQYQRYLDQLPDTVRARVLQHQSNLQHGLYATAPMICKGPTKCGIILHCPFPETDRHGKQDFGSPTQYPIGRQCVVERLFMQTRTVHLAQYLGVDPSNPIEMAIIGELALIDMQKNRVTMLMSVGDRDGQGVDFLRYDTRGFDENGNAAEEIKLHPWMELLDKLEKRRTQHLDRLMATRKAKAEIAARANTGQDSKLIGEIEQLREAILALGQNPTLALPTGARVMLDDE